jgi:hypothetical protein
MNGRCENGRCGTDETIPNEQKVTAQRGVIS